MGEIKKGVKWLASESLDWVGLKPKKPEAQPVIPMPDEELIEQERRRKDTRRASSGRQATILSDGLG